MHALSTLSDLADAHVDWALIRSRTSHLASRLLSGEVNWLAHRVRLAAGWHGPVLRPAPLVSRLGDALCGAHCCPGNTVKILVFSHNLDREGASISLKELVCGLKQRQKVAPEVISFEDGPLRLEYEALGIRVEVMPGALTRISTLTRLRHEVESLSSRIRASDADVVLVNTLLNFPAVLAAEHAGVPSVWNPRESEPWETYFRFLPDAVAQRAIAAIGLPRRVVFVADATRAVWKDFEQAANFAVIHNALHLHRFVGQLSGDRAAQRSALGWSDDEVVFLCVGTVCERKGQADALEALEAMSGELRVPVRLVFVGDASERYAQRQRRYALRFKGNDRVNINFIDSTTEIGSFYLAADVFLLCSRVESYPRVVLEALAFGLPIISTPVFGVVEQLPTPADACFYQPGEVGLLAKQMLEMANNLALRQLLGQRSRIRFAAMPGFDQMLQTYEEVLCDAAKFGSQGDGRHRQLER